MKVSTRYDPQVILPIGYPLVEPQSSPAKQTQLEYLALNPDKTIVSEKKEAIDSSENSEKYSAVDFTKKTCACGCGKRIISLSNRRKFIQGHSKFGVNGLHEVLRSPRICKCGCGMPAEWDWERMIWKKYIDKHIGIKKLHSKRSLVEFEQINMFE